MLHIVVDENIPFAKESFGTLGQVTRVKGRDLSNARLLNADVLVVRSVTQVNEALLANTPVKFVGTATIGTDHVDLDYLQRSGIGFASAPGCNAQAVVEYVASCLFWLQQQRGFQFSGKTLGIFGAGNVGSLLRQLAPLLGMKVLCADPPLAQVGTQGLDSPEQVWQADVLSFHVPYTQQGAHATHHMVTYERLMALPPNGLLINSARGAVVDNQALYLALRQRPDLLAVLDVWEHEPGVDQRLLSQVQLATPHIAGYSLEGKVRGTWSIYQQLMQYFNTQYFNGKPQGHWQQWLGDQLYCCPDLSGGEFSDPLTVEQVLQWVYDPGKDHQALQLSAAMAPKAAAAWFDQLRRGYAVRREFGSVQLVESELIARGMELSARQQLQQLGFQLI